MFANRISLAFVVCALPLRMAGSVNPPAPIYTSAGIVNAASYSAGSLAPNTIASIYGENLSFSTEALAAFDLTDGGLPMELDGVSVYIGPVQAGMYFVSPLQVNFLVPNILTPGVYSLAVVRQGFAGPPVSITLNLTGPGLFSDETGNAIAQHLNGTLVSAASPAVPNEWVVVYAVGLGRTVPDADSYLPSSVAAPIVNIAQFRLLINGSPVPPAAIGYAGITPSCSGLYQINLQIPANAPPTPQIVISIGAALSAGQIQLPIA